MPDLRAYLAEAAAKPFRYGRHDCCTFAAGWVEEARGVDVLRGHRYASLRDGLAKLEEAGMADHVAVFAAALDELPVLLARAGDIAVMPADGPLAALGIVVPGGERIACFGPGGMGSALLTTALQAFRV